MKVAVIGGGIAGLSAAWHLGDQHRLKLFEARPRAGGHADTEFVTLDGKTLAVDTGFIVFNRTNYPVFSQLLDDLGVPAKTSDMSFGVQHEDSGLVYNATSLNRLFIQRRNLVRPRFWRMLRDLVRFYRHAPAQLQQPAAEPGLSAFLKQFGYSQAFASDHLLPMVGALWSMSIEEAGSFPVGFLIGFMQSHGMLSLGRRPQWLTVDGGSIRYVEALLEQQPLDLALDTPVRQVERSPEGIWVTSAQGVRERFDRVVMACHGDVALNMLVNPLEQEQQVLGSIRFQNNDITLHTDDSVLPGQTRARASWNVRVPATGSDAVKGERSVIQVSYLMNLLQGLPTDRPVIVSLNQNHLISPGHIIQQKVYRHPVYRLETWQAKQSRQLISGLDRIHYCGAYWGWGFHESGAATGLAVAREIHHQHRSQRAA